MLYEPDDDGVVDDDVLDDDAHWIWVQECDDRDEEYDIEGDH